MKKLTDTLTSAAALYGAIWKALSRLRAVLPALLAKISATPAARAAFVICILMALSWNRQVATATVATIHSAKKHPTAVLDPRALDFAKALDELEEAKALGFEDDLTRYRIYAASNITVPSHVPDKHIAYMLKAADRHNIPTSIMFRLIQTESEFKLTARSYCGARGYMQLMPGTRRELLHAYKIDPDMQPEYKTNIELGARYLEELYDQAFKVTGQERSAWRLALAYYNAGPDKVAQNGNRVPSYCKKYVNTITRTQP